ncbi:hypothetical protein AMTRI_Chr13g126120 [Amborella trichopoda]
MDRAKRAARVPNIFESVNVPLLHGDVGGLEPNCLRKKGSQVLTPSRKGERCPIEPRMVRSETTQTSLFHFSIPLMLCLAVVYRPTKDDLKAFTIWEECAPQLKW